jgi:hypothetical protein
LPTCVRSPKPASDEFVAVFITANAAQMPHYFFDYPQLNRFTSGREAIHLRQADEFAVSPA